MSTMISYCVLQTTQGVHTLCFVGPVAPPELCLSFSGLLYLVINCSLLQEVLQSESFSTVLHFTSCLQ